MPDHITQDQWNYRFVSPFTWIISGSTGAGKTYMLSTFIENHKRLCVPLQTKLLVAYKHKQPLYMQYSKYIETEFMKEPGVIPKPHELNNASILIIDDLLANINEVIEFFTVHSHHMNVNVIFITQNFYEKGMRTLSLNAHYLTIYKNPRDSSQIQHLSRQLEPQDSKLVTSAYDMATKRAHGYLHINCKQKAHIFFKYRDKIDANDSCSVFVSRKNALVVEITLDKIRLLIEQGLSLEQAVTQFLHESTDTHST